MTTPYEITDGRITVVQDVLAPGVHLARHHHRVMTEVFVVTEGEVTFAFDSRTFVAAQGTAVNVPPRVWHEVTCAAGARLVMVFTPGGFDHYLAQVAGLDPALLSDVTFMTDLAERHDIWHRWDAPWGKSRRVR